MDTEASEHSALRAVVASVCDALGAGESQPGSSLCGRVEALYTQVGKRLKGILHIEMKRAVVAVCSHYLSIDVPTVSEGYIIGDDEDESWEEI